jgi:hypothetical protein
MEEGGQGQKEGKEKREGGGGVEGTKRWMRPISLGSDTFVDHWGHQLEGFTVVNHYIIWTKS